MRQHPPKKRKPIAIAIANDTAIAVEALSRVIHATPDYHLLWVANTGLEAVQYCLNRRPDVILMALNMPGMDGVEATRQIMQRAPCAILIVTASVPRNTAKVLEAMRHGALDAVTTLMMGTDNQDAIDVLLKKIAVVARVVHRTPQPSYPADATGGNKATALTQYTAQHAKQIERPPQAVSSNVTLPRLIVIGTSTGGPHALRQILSQLPASSSQNQAPFKAAIIVIQHLEAQFSTVFVDWLNQFSQLPVSVAQNGDRPEEGSVLIAGTNKHLIMRPNQTLRYKNEPRHYSHRPSVDIFFQSVAQHWPHPGIALLLTGMGRDGTEGMSHLHAVNWHTLAESAESCAVFGMPKSAIDRGVIHRTLSLDQIAPYLIRTVNHPSANHHRGRPQC